ncbi:ribonucleotide reductase N-terminal alpha domain-containing protein [Thermus islandicus]|uniref:ribonucleotide reductase N-terminal alpha domain-containing protein n=1 Tax=Thermus islandicus TaxID=540988 RepID=UPI0003B66D1D|nr:ribonucleotide reductase N-terminal alpha domain-containing protein [Thermus islandicus]
MPRRTYTEEDAERLALDFLGDELRAGVFLWRYALRDPEGRLLEATPREMWERLARQVARVDKGSFQEVLWLLSDFRFVPGGRILFGLGHWRKSTLCNEARLDWASLEEVALRRTLPGRHRGPRKKPPPPKGPTRGH